jgi:hypothetical protein
MALRVEAVEFLTVVPFIIITSILLARSPRRSLLSCIM